MSVYSYNASLENMTLNAEGWCPNIEIEFTLWNATDFENREDKEDDLCGINETPEDDRCEEYIVLKNKKVTIYDGPLDGMPILTEVNTDDNGMFKFTFDEPKKYLIEISDNDDYNEYEEHFEIINCDYANLDKTNYTEPEEKQVIFNQTYTYSSVKTTLNLENTNSNESSNITVSKITNFAEESLPVLKNSTKTIKISSKNTNFTNLEINLEVIKKENYEYSTYKYDVNSNDWKEVNYKDQGNNIIIEGGEFGIYSVVETQVQPLEEPIVEESENEDNSESQEETNSENEVVIFNDEENSSNSTNYLMYGGIAGAIILFSFIIFILTKGKKEKNYHDFRYENKNKEEVKLDEEKLPNYSVEYNRTKEYVQKYKVDYTKDQIYRGLEKANIPKDIIDKVFSEEF